MADKKILTEELYDYYDDFKYQTVTEDVEGKKKYFIRGPFSKGGVVNKNKRLYPVNVLKEQVEQCQEAIKANRMVGELEHPCLIDKNFDVLCETGWKSFEKVEEGEKVLTITDDNFYEYKAITKKIEEPYSGKAYSVRGRNIDSSFTPNHRFYLEDKYGNRQIATLKEIYDDRTKYSHSKIIKVGEWEGNGLDKVNIGEREFDAKDFFAFMGIYLSEGCVVNNKNGKTSNRIYINQNEGEVSEKIRELLASMGLSFKEFVREGKNAKHITFSILDKGLKEYLAPLENCYKKYIPTELKQYDAIYLNELVEWFILGDGRDRRDKTKYQNNGNYSNIFSVSKKLIEDLHECVIKTGGSGNWREIEPKEDYVFAERVIEAKNKSTLYQLNISSTKGIYLDKRMLEIEEIDHDGDIYCLEVEDNHNFYVKQNNKAFITGNSSPKINLERVALKVNELRMADDGTMLGEMEVLDTPLGKTLQTLIDSGVGLGVSTRGTGTVKKVRIRNEKGVYEDINEVQSDFKLRAIDVVFDPSAGEAGTPQFVAEGLEIQPSKPKTTFGEVWDQLFP